MLEYIKGTLIEVTNQHAIIEVSGLGYRLLVPSLTQSKVPHKTKEVCFFISTIIRENSHKTYGFLKREERDFFERINDVSGIGPKIALALLSHSDPIDLKIAMTRGNVPLLSSIPGIGKKTAERLIIEMRDKIAKEKGKAPPRQTKGENTGSDQLAFDALCALKNLGYSHLHAQEAIDKAIKNMDEATPDLETVIRAALKG